jgi:hypothetical protein
MDRETKYSRGLERPDRCVGKVGGSKKQWIFGRDQINRYVRELDYPGNRDRNNAFFGK